MAHLSSAFHVSPFDEAVVVSVDGFGDFASAAWGVGRGTHVEVEVKIWSSKRVRPHPTRAQPRGDAPRPHDGENASREPAQLLRCCAPPVAAASVFHRRKCPSPGRPWAAMRAP